MDEIFNRLKNIQKSMTIEDLKDRNIRNIIQNKQENYAETFGNQNT